MNQAGGGGRGGVPGGVRNPIEMLRSGAFGPMDPTTERVVRAAETGDFTGLVGPERQAAEQMRAMIQLLGSAGGGPRLFQPAAADPDDDGDDRPETIEELLDLVSEDGTHSVLDIQTTGRRREFGVATPYPARGVEQVFGTDRPTREQVEESWADVAERLERWEAHYLVVYKDGKPAQYAFIGCSGD